MYIYMHVCTYTHLCIHTYLSQHVDLLNINALCLGGGTLRACSDHLQYACKSGNSF